KQVSFIQNVIIDSKKKLEELKNKNIKFVIIDTARAKKLVPRKKAEPEVVEPPKEEPKPEPVVEKVAEPEPEPEPEEQDEELDNFDDDGKKKVITTARVPFEVEVEKAKEIKNEAFNNVKNMLANAAVGKSFEAETAKTQVNDMVKSVFRNKDALISLTRLKSFDDYTFMHSVNVSVLAIALSRELGYKKEDVEIIGLGSMLHDVGKMLVPEQILNKPGKLTPEERVEIQKHTTFGYELLKERGDIPEKAYLIAYEHHERADGTGYPMGKKLDEIQPVSSVANIVDVYDALTSARVYKPGMPPPHALSFIKARAETEFRADYVDTFLDVIGIFPVGSVVEFNTGQLGIVKEINRDNLFEPAVILVMNAQKQLLGAPREIAPSKYESNDLKIIRYHDPVDLGINVPDYLDLQAKRI
ncbi:HD-GYP domain-containing protein, partial [candidate division KSB1 bacterium]